MHLLMRAMASCFLSSVIIYWGEFQKPSNRSRLFFSKCVFFMAGYAEDSHVSVD